MGAQLTGSGRAQEREEQSEESCSNVVDDTSDLSGDGSWVGWELASCNWGSTSLDGIGSVLESRGNLNKGSLDGGDRGLDILRLGEWLDLLDVGLDERSGGGNVLLKALESYDSCLSLGNISGGRCESGALS